MVHSYDEVLSNSDYEAPCHSMDAFHNILFKKWLSPKEYIPCDFLVNLRKRMFLNFHILMWNVYVCIFLSVAYLDHLI